MKVVSTKSYKMSKCEYYKEVAFNLQLPGVCLEKSCSCGFGFYLILGLTFKY